MNKRIMGLVFSFVGVLLIVIGIFSGSREYEPIEDDTVKMDVKYLGVSDIEEFLKDKYKSDFEYMNEVKSYCLDLSKTNSYYTDSCKDNSIYIKIHKVKSLLDNIEFYVKEVVYDEEFVTILDDEMSFLGEKLYDNYISYNVKKKLEEYLFNEYKRYYEKAEDIILFEGLGIDNTLDMNCYQYLDYSFQEVVDRDISLDDFIDKDYGLDIKIVLNSLDVLDKGNVKSEIEKIADIIPIKYHGTNIERLVVYYKNNVFIAYENGSFSIYGGNNYTSSILDSKDLLYDKYINLTGFSTSGISYEDFMLIPEESFNF